MKHLSEQVTIKVDPALRERLETAAARDQRPLASFIRKMIIDGLPKLASAGVEVAHDAR